MRSIDLLGLKLCKYQAELFEASCEQLSCGTRIFVRRFMNSQFARRIDACGVLFESTSVVDGLEEIEKEYGASSYGKEKYSAEELYWIGYIYRYWAYCFDLTSRQLYKKVKPEQLRLAYYPYHTMDPQQAVERLRETLDRDTGNNIDDIARGVEVLRRVRNKYARLSR